MYRAEKELIGLPIKSQCGSQQLRAVVCELGPSLYLEFLEEPMEITKMAKSYAEDAPDRNTQIYGFENARDRLTPESLEVLAIDASTLTPEKRHDVVYSLAICKAEGITKEIMPWEAALDRINLGVDIPQLLAHFRPNSRQ
jgi:hypothetical protein